MTNRFAPIKNSFVAGEISGRLEGRDELDQYFQGMRQGVNGVVLPHGGFMSRSGTRHVNEVKNSAHAGRLLRFQVSVDLPYVIEAGDQYFRFYVNNGRLEDSGAVEVTTPYLHTELELLQWTQEANIAYFTHPNHPTYKLVRTSATAFSFTRVAYRDGHAPLRAANLDDTITVTYTFPGSVPTLTWSEDIGLSASTDIGRYVRATDGDHEVWLLITGVTSGSVVTGTLEGSSGTPTSVTSATDWALGAESDNEGFYATTFYQGRFGLFGPRENPDLWYLSKSDDFENFELLTAGGTDAENADKSVAKRVTSQGQSNAIAWATDADETLVIGTIGGEFRVEGDSSGVLTPTDTTVVPATKRGSVQTLPISIDSVVLFVQRNGQKIREFTFDFEKDGRVARDISILAEHLLRRSPAKEITYQQDPDSTVWIVRRDGVLIGMTFEREQKIIGAARNIIGGSYLGGNAVVESVTVIPSPDGTTDQLWLLVKRTVNGATVRYVEYMEAQFSPAIDPTSSVLERITALDQAYFVDSGLSLDAPLPITGITKANPAVVTVSDVTGLSNGGIVRIRDVMGEDPSLTSLGDSLNNRSYKVANLSGSTFELTDQDTDAGIDTSELAAYVTGGTARIETTAISGLSHLEGETVQILADGAVQPSKVVASGAITLDTPASIVHVGLGFDFIGETERFVGGGKLGTDQGQRGRITRCVLRLIDSSLAFDIGTGAVPERFEEIEDRDVNDFMDMAVPLFQGDKDIAMPGGWSRERTVYFRQTRPLPLHVVALMPKMEVGEG